MKSQEDSTSPKGKKVDIVIPEMSGDYDSKIQKRVTPLASMQNAKLKGIKLPSK
eukprot:CAMPEP_0202976984 /NCGR_PEP_ID=MMETSP1396-20130829/82351_1 /ASSEMBLY_ACC=CAM_ASM_000872 /TAXON_ID= /ORGANISM="Pseudokeronopsis sp., Strain Brazil" /LENGTH=53 /DNA_ID=CAMNT_0049715315 /DNA_START=116 /DNA_END=274 /DNA_ORIENTATION=+